MKQNTIFKYLFIISYLRHQSSSILTSSSCCGWFNVSPGFKCFSQKNHSLLKTSEMTSRCTANLVGTLRCTCMSVGSGNFQKEKVKKKDILLHHFLDSLHTQQQQQRLQKNQCQICVASIVVKLVTKFFSGKKNTFFWKTWIFFNVFLVNDCSVFCLSSRWRPSYLKYRGGPKKRLSLVQRKERVPRSLVHTRAHTCHKQSNHFARACVCASQPCL